MNLHGGCNTRLQHQASQSWPRATSTRAMPRYSKWTAAQAALATSDPDIFEATSKDDYWQAMDVMGQSFAGDAEHAGEPSIEWMNKTTPLADRSHPDRVPVITMSNTIDRLYYTRKGGGFFAIRGANNNMAAVVYMCKLKGGSKPANPWSMWNMMKGFAALGMEKRIPAFFTRKDPETKALRKQYIAEQTSRGKLLDNVSNKLKAKHGPKPYYYYVAIAAVLPTEQGKGHCSKLFKALHRIADAEGVPCFLDCGSEKNVAVYTRLGYKLVASETRSAGPSDDVTIYVMVREVPGGASSAI